MSLFEWFLSTVHLARNSRGITYVGQKSRTKNFFAPTAPTYYLWYDVWLLHCAWRQFLIKIKIGSFCWATFEVEIKIFHNVLTYDDNLSLLLSKVKSYNFRGEIKRLQAKASSIHTIFYLTDICECWQIWNPIKMSTKKRSKLYIA